jgi:putative ABC transport system ATP-binding protein
MAIRLSNICFSYPEQPRTPILTIKNWSLAPGEHAFIYGPSGSGKSTLLNILNGLLCPNEGLVTILGQQLNNLPRNERDVFRANNMGYVFQQFNLIPYLNAIDNIRLASYFAKPSSSPTKQSLKKDITGVLSTLNIAVNDWKKPVRKLSIGQQQRIAIARALINKPALLIADEPTSSLDRDNTERFMVLLMSVVKKYDITLLFVSHDMSLSHYFTRVESLTDISNTGVSSRVN